MLIIFWSIKLHSLFKLFVKTLRGRFAVAIANHPTITDFLVLFAQFTGQFPEFALGGILRTGKKRPIGARTSPGFLTKGHFLLCFDPICRPGTAFGVHDLYCNIAVRPSSFRKKQFRKPIPSNTLRYFRHLLNHCGTECVMELSCENWSRLEPVNLSTNPERWI